MWAVYLITPALVRSRADLTSLEGREFSFQLQVGSVFFSTLKADGAR